MDRKARELYENAKSCLKGTYMYKNINNKKIKGVYEINGLSVMYFKNDKKDKIATLHPSLGLIVGEEYSPMNSDVYVIGNFNGKLGYIGYKNGKQYEKKVTEKEAPKKMSKVQLMVIKSEDDEKLYVFDTGSKPVTIEKIDEKLSELEKQMY